MADKKKSEQTVGDVINEQLEKERSALKQDVSKPQNIQYNLEDDSKNKSGINNLFGLLKRKNTNQAPLQQTQTQTMENKNTLAPLPKTNIETEKLQIDVEKLQSELGVPVVPVCGITGFGIKDLVEKFSDVSSEVFDKTNKDQKWEEIGRILDICQKLHHHHHTFLEKLEDISTRPSSGLPIAIGVVVISMLSAIFSINEVSF